MMRAIEARLLAEHGLSANDFEALVHLSHAEEGALRRIDLADRLRLSPSGVTRLLDGLEHVGPHRPQRLPDGRARHLRDDHRQGPRDAREAAQTHAAACEELIGAHFAQAELDDLAALLDRLPGVGTRAMPQAARGPSVDAGEKPLTARRARRPAPRPRRA